ncbi:hypothetical protein [Komarekiella delphini-convector]|nr:hypothetical protein [Komarekiella delphini-convector]
MLTSNIEVFNEGRSLKEEGRRTIGGGFKSTTNCRPSNHRFDGGLKPVWQEERRPLPSFFFPLPSLNYWRLTF